MGSGGDATEIEIRLVASVVHCTCTVRFNRSHFTVTVIRDGGGGFALLASSLGVRACAANIHVNALTIIAAPQASAIRRRPRRLSILITLNRPEGFVAPA